MKKTNEKLLEYMNMKQARERIESGIYHVVLRGINRQDIFYDDEDYQHLNEILRKIKASNGITLRKISGVTGLSVDILFKAWFSQQKERPSVGQ